MALSEQTDVNPWGYAIVVRAIVPGALHRDPARAKQALDAMCAAAPREATMAHGHFERIDTEPVWNEGMGT